jgi:hypothetical protein
MSKQIINLLNRVPKLLEYKKRLGTNPDENKLKNLEDKQNNLIDDITSNISNMLGAETSSTSSFYPHIHEIISQYVNHVINGVEMDNNIYINIFQLSMAYLFALLVALIMDADIPVASTVVGVYHVTNKTCTNVNEIHELFEKMGLGFISKFISIAQYGCIPITVINEAGHLVVAFWSFILSFVLTDKHIMEKLNLVKEILTDPSKFQTRITELIDKVKNMDLQNIREKFKKGELQEEITGTFNNMKEQYNTMKYKVKNSEHYQNFKNSVNNSKQKLQDNKQINTLTSLAMGQSNTLKSKLTSAMGQIYKLGLHKTEIDKFNSVVKKAEKLLTQDKFEELINIILGDEKKLKDGKITKNEAINHINDLADKTRKFELKKAPHMNNSETGSASMGGKWVNNAISKKRGKGKSYNTSLFKQKQTNKKRKTRHHKKKNKYTKNYKKYHYY